MDGNTTLSTVTLSGGKGVFSTATLGAGSHNISAIYNGSTNIMGSASATFVQNVN
jgi:hypothetical protein